MTPLTGVRRLILILLKFGILNCVFGEAVEVNFLLPQPHASEMLVIAITGYIKALWEKTKCF